MEKTVLSVVEGFIKDLVKLPKDAFMKVLSVSATGTRVEASVCLVFDGGAVDVGVAVKMDIPGINIDTAHGVDKKEVLRAHELPEPKTRKYTRHIKPEGAKRGPKSKASGEITTSDDDLKIMKKNLYNWDARHHLDENQQAAWVGLGKQNIRTMTEPMKDQLKDLYLTILEKVARG